MNLLLKVQDKNGCWSLVPVHKTQELNNFQCDIGLFRKTTYPACSWISVVELQSTHDILNLQGKLKKVRVIGSWEQITRKKENMVFTVQY